MSRIFFYGLFMDRALLVAKGLHPEVIGPAELPGYRIHIGDRATLVPAPSRRALGVVMELTEEEARALYAEPSVRAYRPERLPVTLLDTGQAIEAACWLLPPDTSLAGANPAYAADLARLAESLGFDPAYVAEIAVFGAGPREG